MQKSSRIQSSVLKVMKHIAVYEVFCPTLFLFPSTPSFLRQWEFATGKATIVHEGVPHSIYYYSNVQYVLVVVAVVVVAVGERMFIRFFRLWLKGSNPPPSPHLPVAKL